MKCPKCSLVTFDYLSKCPRCDTSFELSRRLTRRRADPKRRILIASGSSPVSPAAAVDRVETGAPEPGRLEGLEIPLDSPAERPLAAVEKIAAMATPTTLSPSRSAETPSLREMAETEQREDLAVNVASAVAAARAAVGAPVAQPAPPPVALASPESDLAPGDPELSESRRIKERMMRASRARRKERPDLVTESTDPVLPDWYEPDLDEPDGAPRSKGDSADRR